MARKKINPMEKRVSISISIKQKDLFLLASKGIQSGTALYQICMPLISYADEFDLEITHNIFNDIIDKKTACIKELQSQIEVLRSLCDDNGISFE